MEIIERQGEGKFALATRNARKGDLVHVAHPLICVPNIGRIRTGTVCCGCLKRISPSKEFLSSSSSKKDKDSSSSSSPPTATTDLPPFVCQHCNVATYCSKECREHNSAAHLNSGECGAMTLFDKQNNGNVQETDEEALVIACLVARALIEGYTSFPLQQAQNGKQTVVSAILGEDVVTAIEIANAEFKKNNNSSNAVDLVPPPVFKQFASVQQEIDFVRNQPRVSVASLFPEFISSRDEENVVREEVTKSACSILPPTSSVTTASNHATNSSLLLQRDQQERLAAIQISYKNSFASSNNNDDVEQEGKHKIIKINSSGAVPTFISYCDLVSNAAAMTKPQLEYVEKLRMRYFNLAKKKMQTLHHQNQQQQTQNNESPASCSSSLFVIHQRPIDPLFFVHFFSAYASNCFGAFDPKTDKKISAGVYPDASYFNHSCAPNLVRRREGRFECFYATKDIKQGESLNIDYNASDSDFRGLEERREHLLMHYRFWCICDRCNGKINDDDEKTNQNDDDDDEKAQKKPSMMMSLSDYMTKNGNHDHVESSKSKRNEKRHCESCNIGGYMRAMFDPTSHELAGFECRFCFAFIPV